MRRRCRAATYPADWDAPVPGTGARGVLGVGGRLVAQGFRGADRLYGYRPARSWRRRSWPRPTDCGGATRSRQGRWRSTPNATAPARGRVSAHPISSMCQRIRCSSSCPRGWVGRSARSSCPRAVRDDHAAVDGGGHDDLPGVDDGRPGRAGGPHGVVGARRRNAGGGEAHRTAADAVLRSRRGRAGVHAVRRGVDVRRSGCRYSTTGWTSGGWTGSATAPSTRWRIRARRQRSSTRRWRCPRTTC